MDRLSQTLVRVFGRFIGERDEPADLATAVTPQT
jgi:hypothetical protein